MKVQIDTVPYKNGTLTLPELRKKFQDLPGPEKAQIMSVIVNATRRIYSQSELADFLAKLSDPSVATACWEAQLKKWEWWTL